jgi:type IV pilus assembly protein PilE
MHRQRGMTLIELMVVVMIIGILAAIAVPSYLSYTRKARRADAKVALTSIAQQFERCYTRYNSYTNPNCNVVLPFDTPRGTYTIDADAAALPAPGGVNDQTFAIKATPKNDQVKDTTCGTFTLNNVGVKGVTGASGATNCW